MKGFMMVMMLLAILVTAYLIAQDMKAKKDMGTPSMEVFKKASGAGEKVNQASEAQEDRLKKILGE
jgi:uncharacterized protein YdeI (BOF family)